MEIRVLNYFLTIAREKSFSKAAEVLHVTQPTLSRQIQELEEQYNKKFFQRHSRCVCLTEDGILFKKRAEEIIALVTKTESELNCSHSKLVGDIHIGCVESIGFKVIASTIKKMQKLHPSVKFHITSGNDQDLKEKLDAGILDFALVIEPVELKAYDFIKIPHYDTWGLWMKDNQELYQYETITPSLLKSVNIITSDCELFANQIAGWLGGNHRSYNITGYYNLISNAFHLIEDDTYVLGLDFDFYKGYHFKPLSPALKVQLDIIWKKYQTFSKPVEVFLDLLNEQIDNYRED